VEPDEESDTPEEAMKEDDQSMFVPENQPSLMTPSASTFGSSLNPEASTFNPKFGDAPASAKPPERSTFGQPTSFNGTGFGGTGFGTFGSAGGLQPATSSTTTFGKPPVTQQPSQQQKQEQAPVFGFGGFTNPSKEVKATSSTSAEPNGAKAVEGPLVKEPALSGPTQAQSTFSGFGFGKAVSSPATTLSAASFTPASASATIPPIFGPRPGLTSGPIEGRS
jgi:hypothetical protein